MGYEGSKSKRQWQNHWQNHTLLPKKTRVLHFLCKSNLIYSAAVSAVVSESPLFKSFVHFYIWSECLARLVSSCWVFARLPTVLNNYFLVKSLLRLLWAASEAPRLKEWIGSLVSAFSCLALSAKQYASPQIGIPYSDAPVGSLRFRPAQRNLCCCCIIRAWSQLFWSFRFLMSSPSSPVRTRPFENGVLEGTQFGTQTK